ncbi:MAG: hypothetical protein IJ391_00775 [Clostridia bacterium]|nr:hypothetical protein [Clostridia bacterium]
MDKKESAKKAFKIIGKIVLTAFVLLVSLYLGIFIMFIGVFSMLPDVLVVLAALLFPGLCIPLIFSKTD